MKTQRRIFPFGVGSFLRSVPSERLNERLGRLIGRTAQSGRFGKRYRRVSSLADLASAGRFDFDGHEAQSNLECESGSYRVSSNRHIVPVCNATPGEHMAFDVSRLAPDRCLARSGKLSVYIAKADEIPSVLREIGRLREITFRAAGEGTGNESDIDRYDRHYLHLFVWNRVEEEVVGGYRLGLVDQIRARYGRKGLYTHSLFRYGGRLLKTMDPAIELGRSFVREEYQRSFAPLMLLWKGIGAFVAANPRYSFLFGPVSISNHYRPLSQQLIVDYLRRHARDRRRSRYVRARHHFARSVLPSALIGQSSGDLDELGKLVSLIEPDNKGVPILLRQYLKLGGQILGFNRDMAFNSLDALIMVDLRQTDPRVLSKYMGAEVAENFLAFHRQTDLCA